jgi:hypothetical protein
MNFFKAKLGETEAKQIIEFIDLKADEKINQKKDVLLVKDDKPVNARCISRWNVH